MSLKVVFVVRRDPETSSVERVFSIIGNRLRERGIDVREQKLRFGNSLKGVIGNFFASRPAGFDIYHITGQAHYYALLLPIRKTVLTVHDLVVLNYRSSFRKYLVKKLFYDLPVRKARYITVVSEYIKNELVTATNCAEEKITVIENPLTVGVEAHQRPFNIDCPRLLHIGTALHKNLPNLIKALERIQCHLTIIGRVDAGIIKMLGANSIKFENRSGLSDEEILEEYRKTDIVSFCSLTEGFGLPIVEAQALSIPLITSDLSPMKDVAGDGAMLVDPYRPECIRAGILRIINEENTRLDIVAKGRDNIERFRPEKIAAKYQQLYTEIATNKKRDHGGN